MVVSKLMGGMVLIVVVLTVPSLNVALIVAVPNPTAEAKPRAEIVATAVLVELQVTNAVRFTGEIVGIAVSMASNCRVSPIGTFGLSGVIFTKV